MFPGFRQIIYNIFLEIISASISETMFTASREVLIDRIIENIVEHFQTTFAGIFFLVVRRSMLYSYICIRLYIYIYIYISIARQSRGPATAL